MTNLLFQNVIVKNSFVADFFYFLCVYIYLEFPITYNKTNFMRMAYKRKYGGTSSRIGKRRKFTFRKGRPTWKSMYKATKKSTWTKKKTYRRPRSQGQDPLYSSCNVSNKSDLSFRTAKRIAAPTLVKTTGMKRLDVAVNTQASHAFNALSGYPSTSNGASINDCFSNVSLTAVFNFINIDWLNMNFTLTNLSNSSMVVYIRDIDCRKDIALAFDSYNPVTAWSNTTSDISNSGAWTLNDIGAKPSDGSDFYKLFRVVRCTKITLNPGQFHRHVYRCGIKKRVGLADVRNSGITTDLHNLAYVTKWCMFTAHGYGVCSDATPGNVGYAPVSLAITYDTKLCYNFVSDTNKVIYETANTLDPIQNITDPIIMNDDSGIAAPWGAA